MTHQTTPLRLQINMSYVQMDGRIRRVVRQTRVTGFPNAVEFVTDTGLRYQPDGKYVGPLREFDLVGLAPSPGFSRDAPEPVTTEREPHKFNTEKFVEDVRRTIARRGWTMKDFAARIGYKDANNASTQLAMWLMRGHVPRADRFLMICDKLGLSPQVYLRGAS